jgi:hypothetical protein
VNNSVACETRPSTAHPTLCVHSTGSGCRSRSAFLASSTCIHTRALPGPHPRPSSSRQLIPTSPQPRASAGRFTPLVAREEPPPEAERLPIDCVPVLYEGCLVGFNVRHLPPPQAHFCSLCQATSDPAFTCCVVCVDPPMTSCSKSAAGCVRESFRSLSSGAFSLPPTSPLASSSPSAGVECSHTHNTTGGQHLCRAPLTARRVVCPACKSVPETSAEC